MPPIETKVRLYAETGSSIALEFKYSLKNSIAAMSGRAMLNQASAMPKGPDRSAKYTEALAYFDAQTLQHPIELRLVIYPEDGGQVLVEFKYCFNTSVAAMRGRALLDQAIALPKGPDRSAKYTEALAYFDAQNAEAVPAQAQTEADAQYVPQYAHAQAAAPMPPAPTLPSITDTSWQHWDTWGNANGQPSTRQAPPPAPPEDPMRGTEGRFGTIRITQNGNHVPIVELTASRADGTALRATSQVKYLNGRTGDVPWSVVEAKLRSQPEYRIPMSAVKVSLSKDGKFHNLIAFNPNAFIDPPSEAQRAPLPPEQPYGSDF